MCRGERCMQASTPPHTKHMAKLTQRHYVMITLLPPEVTCTQTHARACSVQYYVACKGLNVTATIHTAHAQKHFSPETKSKVGPKKFFARTSSYQYHGYAYEMAVWIWLTQVISCSETAEKKATGRYQHWYQWRNRVAPVWLHDTTHVHANLHWIVQLCDSGDNMIKRETA